MKKRVLSILFCLSFNSYALVEFSAEYGLSKSLYGAQKQNEIQGKTYSGSIAWYVFSTTALELNYVQSKNINTQNLANPGSGDFVSKITSEVITESYGIGIRQLLSSPKAVIKPMISLGYAREINEYTTTYTLEDVTTPTSIDITESPLEVERNSVFATFALEIKLSEHFSIKGSMGSFFPAFEFDQWDNDLRYTAGISILFF